MKFNSLKKRVLIWFGTIITALLVLFSFGFYYFFNQSINLSIESNLNKTALLIENKIESNIPIKEILKDKSLTHLQIAILKNGNLIYKTDNFNLKNLNNSNLSHTTFETIDNEENLSAIYTLRFKKPFDGTIVLVQEDIDDKVENLVDTMLVLNPLLLALILFIASRLIDKIVLPIKEITGESKKINMNKLVSKIDTNYNYKDEISELINSFDDMTKRLKEQFQRVERFNCDISHELKTPLTSIKGEAKFILRKSRTPKEYIQSLQTIVNVANDMQEMIDNLLLFVQYSNENIQNTFKEVELDTVLIMVLEKYDKKAKDKNIKITIDKIESITYNANPHLITIIFSNIIDNAIKYSNDNKNITISLFKADKIYFIVQDEGIGIPQDKLSSVTDRFYRVDQSRNKNIKGFGLGLSIVKNSVELHNASINIDSKLDVGTTVKIVF